MRWNFNPFELCCMQIVLIEEYNATILNLYECRLQIQSNSFFVVVAAVRNFNLPFEYHLNIEILCTHSGI